MGRRQATEAEATYLCPVHFQPVALDGMTDIKKLPKDTTLSSDAYAIRSCGSLVLPQHSMSAISTSHRLWYDSPYTILSQYPWKKNFYSLAEPTLPTPDTPGVHGAAMLPSQVREHFSFD